jgi:hypothetical protein
VGFLSKAIVGFHLVKTAGLLANAAQFPVLRRGGRAPVRPRTSLLVPARDEAARLPRLLPGLLAQPVEEIVILDDGSTDGTADVVRASADSRLRLLTGVAPPPGWIGKNWACQQLAQAATGEVLIFCDADVVLADGAVDAVWEQLRRQRSDVFSVFPRQLTDTVGERLLVPLIDETLLAFLPHRLLDAPVRAAATANGQLLAFRRAAYEHIGGHQAVFDQILEDVALARRARRLGLRLGLALGGDLVQARMYEDYASTVAGLGKSLRAAHAGSRALLAVNAAFHLAAYTLPWLLVRRGPAWRTAALLGVAQRLLANAKTGRRAYAEGALVPVTPLAALPVFAVAARERARWKGRSYP